MEPRKMDRKKTMTMNWDGLRDVDDEFFESCDRLSTAVPLDLASSGSDDDDEDFDDCRISFASAVSSGHRASNFRGFAPANTAAGMSPDYDIWMASPGSIKERRQRLFQGMGLSSNKDLLSFKHGVANKTPNGQVQTTTTTSTATNSQVPSAVNASSTTENQGRNQDSSKQGLPHESPLPILFVRSRSESEIEALSIEKKRKEELLGTVSKQRLTRTSSLILTPQAKSYHYQENIRNSPKSGGNCRRVKPNGLTSVISKNRFGAFFLIKNLDTGKEFIVNEYDQDGMWNKLSDLQTGKQLTMDEFEKCVGYSPVVKELMRRENVDRMMNGNDPNNERKINSYFSKSLRGSKRRGAAMLKSIKGVANSMHLRGEKERDLAADQKGGKKENNQWVKVRHTGKSYKELSALHLCQEIQAHEGSIWTIKFSTDARFLASAGEDKIIQVWEVQECEVMSMSEGSLTPLHPSLTSSPIHPSLSMSNQDQSGVLDAAGSNLQDKKKKGKGSASKKGNPIPDYVHVPEAVFSLSDRPICSFKGHLDDVLDLSWSRSQQLLSSSMDKTVRLWDLETKSCLKLFAHNDYVTCIQFNPMDDDYFISGSLDAKVRIWDIPSRKVVDWTDLHEMVTAACYTPDGQGAIIGLHKGACRTYSTEDCKLTQLEQICFQKGKAPKKMTGFQFCPINPSEVLVTSADSRIRILDGSEVIYKFRGFRNTSSQIAASFTSDGKYVISASEDSQVFVWRRDEPRNAGTGKRSVITARAHEHFPCKDVSVAITWPGTLKSEPPQMPAAQSKRHSKRCQQQQSSDSPTKDDSPRSNNKDNNNNKKGLPPLPKKNNNNNNNNNNIDRTVTPPEEEVAQVSSTDTGTSEPSTISNSPSIRQGDSPSISASSASNLSSSASIRAGDSASISSNTNPSSASIRYGDSPSISSSSATPSSSWPSSWSWFDVVGGNNYPTQATAWGMVIVTATLGGEIRIYQNFGLPRRIGRL